MPSHKVKSLKVDTLPSDLKRIADKLLAEKFGGSVEGEIETDKTVRPLKSNLADFAATVTGTMDNNTINNQFVQKPYRDRNAGLIGYPMVAKDYNSLWYLISCSYCGDIVQRFPSNNPPPTSMAHSVSPFGTSGTTGYTATQINHTCNGCGAKVQGTVNIN